MLCMIESTKLFAVDVEGLDARACTLTVTVKDCTVHLPLTARASEAHVPVEAHIHTHLARL